MEGLIVSADWAEQRNEAQIGLALTENVSVCLSEKESEASLSWRRRRHDGEEPDLEGLRQT